MKVAYLTTYFNGAVDGRFGRFHDWVHTLRDMDDPPFEFEVVALTASNPDETLTSPPHAFLGQATDLWGTRKNNVEFGLNVPRALRDLWQIDYDILHVLTLDTIAYPVALTASRRAPVVGPDVQGYFPSRDGEQWNQSGIHGLADQVHFRFRRGLHNLADDPTYVALSQYHADNISSLTGGAVSQIRPGVDPIFNPGDSRAATHRQDPTSFLYVGDLSPYKGYDLFLQALAQMPTNVDFEATVIGHGDPQCERIQDLGLSEEVTVEGFVRRENLPRYYRNSDFYVMPSVDENGPNTIVEALACGTPVLATDKLGINEYAPADASLYFDRTPSSIRKAMTTAHSNRTAYAAAALEHAPSFSAERTVESLETLYRNHLDRHS